MKPLSKYSLGTVAQLWARNKKNLDVLFLWLLLIGNVAGWGCAWVLSADLGDSPLHETEGGFGFPHSGEEYDCRHFPKYVEGTIYTYGNSGIPMTHTEEDGWLYDYENPLHPELEGTFNNHSSSQLVQDDPSLQWYDERCDHLATCAVCREQIDLTTNMVSLTDTATDDDPELYYITHYGPPTFGPYEETAWGMTLVESEAWAQQLASEWGITIDGICAAHEYTPWYQRYRKHPYVVEVPYGLGAGTYMVLDRKGEDDSVGIDIYESSQDGAMYNYPCEVIEITGWWCTEDCEDNE